MEYTCRTFCYSVYPFYGFPARLFLTFLTLLYLQMPTKSVVDLSTERKFMYGMFYLYVDDEGEPFTGWVKSNHDAGTLKQIGFLQKGRKEGVWMDWYAASGKQSDIHWTEDRMEGSFTVWHQNGKLKVVGQTKDGEVDGSWAEYYPDGQLLTDPPTKWAIGGYQSVESGWINLRRIKCD